LSILPLIWAKTGLLATACVSHGLGLFLLGFRDRLPELVTIIVANVLILMGIVFYLEATRRFLETSKSIHPFGIVVLPLFIIAFIYYTYYFPSINNRILSITAAIAIFSFLCAREFFQQIPKYERPPRVTTAMVFVIYGLFQVYRFIWTLGETTIQSFMDAGTVHAFAFIFVILLIIGSAFGFIWMVSKRLEYDLKEIANHDQLTQILNRRGVEALALREISNLRRDGTELAIALVDIDHFKEINDQYGHHIGDLALKGFADLIGKKLRSHDIFGRIGGEEFIIILPQTTSEQALLITERLRELVESHIFKLEGHEIKITASFGVAACSPEIDTLQELMPYADKALYHSKQLGRNKVSLYQESDSDQG
jgi:diguanylate cyclase (GGDEF)-like protein